MADTKVREIQIWLNSVYKDNENWVTIKEDGITGNNTVAGLIRALQIELGVGVDGVIENGTVVLINITLQEKGMSLMNNLAALMMYLNM